jgi:hypothetical protein
LAIQKDKRIKKEQQTQTINIDLLNDFLTKNTTETTTNIPKELKPFATLINIDNVIVDLYQITYFTLKNNSYKILIFTKDITNKQLELEYTTNNDYNEKFNTLDKLKKGNINYVDNNLLELIKDDILSNNERLKLIASTRTLPIKEFDYVDIDTRERFDDCSLIMVNEKKEKELKKLNTTRAKILYDAKIPSGIIIKVNRIAKEPTIKLKFNMFDKSDVVFKSLDTNFTIDAINTAIQYLQKIIINSNDLIFLCNQVAHHYSNPFDTQHRRIFIILYGGHRTGKTTTTKIIADLFNSNTYNVSFNTIKDFNKQLQGTAFISFNEYDKTKESGDHIKRYSDADMITINEKNMKMYEHPHFAMYMGCNNPSEKRPITNLIETRDNRNFLIEMDNTDENALTYLNNTKNYKTIQTAMIIIALKHALSLNIMSKLTERRTGIMNLEKIDFIGFWNYLKKEIEKQETTKNILTNEETTKYIAISIGIFKKYFKNQTIPLLENDANFKNIINLKETQIGQRTTNKNIIKENENGYTTTTTNRARCYIITQTLTNNINENIAILENIDNTNIKLNFNKNELTTIKQKLNNYINQRKLNFKF